MTQANESLTAHLDKITAALLHGLTTDGAHHKQYALEEALRLLTGDEFAEKAYREFQWERGIPS